MINNIKIVSCLSLHGLCWVGLTRVIGLLHHFAEVLEVEIPQSLVALAELHTHLASGFFEAEQLDSEIGPLANRIACQLVRRLQVRIPGLHPA